MVFTNQPPPPSAPPPPSPPPLVTQNSWRDRYQILMSRLAPNQSSRLPRHIFNEFQTPNLSPWRNSLNDTGSNDSQEIIYISPTYQKQFLLRVLPMLRLGQILFELVVLSTFSITHLINYLILGCQLDSLVIGNVNNKSINLKF